METKPKSCYSAVLRAATLSFTFFLFKKFPFLSFKILLLIPPDLSLPSLHSSQSPPPLLLYFLNIVRRIDGLQKPLMWSVNLCRMHPTRELVHYDSNGNQGILSWFLSFLLTKEQYAYLLLQAAGSDECVGCDLKGARVCMTITCASEQVTEALFLYRLIHSYCVLSHCSDCILIVCWGCSGW